MFALMYVRRFLIRLFAILLFIGRDKKTCCNVRGPQNVPACLPAADARKKLRIAMTVAPCFHLSRMNVMTHRKNRKTDD